MMDQIRSQDLEELLRTDGAPCASIFMPTHRAGPDTRQDPIRLKNLLREATDRLKESALRDTEAAEVLKPAQDLVGDNDFWQHQAEGLALFCAPGRFVSYRLPLRFENLVVINRRFHVKPLLPLVSADGRFYVLAVSQNETRVLVGSRQSVRTLHLDTIPTSLADAMKFEEPERELQWHTGTAGRIGNRAAVFHGHGDDEDNKDRILRYFRQIDAGLHDVLRDERAPLLLAAVDFEVPIYREANTYPHLLDEHVSGNPERLRPDELHQRAWAVVEPTFREEQRRAAARAEEALGKSRGTADVGEAVRAAMQGRVETMFVDVTQHCWGRWDPDSDRVTVHDEARPEDDDLLDLAAMHTLRNGGAVYAVQGTGEVPGGDVLAATLRG